MAEQHIQKMYANKEIKDVNENYVNRKMKINSTENKTVHSAVCEETFIPKNNLNRHIEQHSSSSDRQDQSLVYGKAWATIHHKSKATNDRSQQYGTEEQGRGAMSRWGQKDNQKNFDVKRENGEHNPVPLHSGRTFKCKNCDKSFIDPRRLKQHLHEAHPRLYECVVCKQTFTWQTALTRHLLEHTSKNPHQCALL